MAADLASLQARAQQWNYGSGREIPNYTGLQKTSIKVMSAAVGAPLSAGSFATMGLVRGGFYVTNTGLLGNSAINTLDNPTVGNMIKLGVGATYTGFSAGSRLATEALITETVVSVGVDRIPME